MFRQTRVGCVGSDGVRIASTAGQRLEGWEYLVMHRSPCRWDIAFSAINLPSDFDVGSEKSSHGSCTPYIQCRTVGTRRAGSGETKDHQACHPLCGFGGPEGMGLESIDRVWWTKKENGGGEKPTGREDSAKSRPQWHIRPDLVIAARNHLCLELRVPCRASASLSAPLRSVCPARMCFGCQWKEPFPDWALIAVYYDEEAAMWSLPINKILPEPRVTLFLVLGSYPDWPILVVRALKDVSALVLKLACPPRLDSIKITLQFNSNTQVLSVLYSHTTSRESLISIPSSTGTLVSVTDRLFYKMDKMDKTSNNTSAGTKLTGSNLAHYQDQWERIHNKTIREIKEARGRVCPLIYDITYLITYRAWSASRGTKSQTEPTDSKLTMDDERRDWAEPCVAIAGSTGTACNKFNSSTCYRSIWREHGLGHGRWLVYDILICWRDTLFLFLLDIEWDCFLFT